MTAHILERGGHQSDAPPNGLSFEESEQFVLSQWLRSHGRRGGEHDLVCVHVEAPDEASHQGDADAKVRALEEIDAKIVAPLAAHLAQAGDHRILVCPDHPTFISTKTHSRGAVPFLVAGTGVTPSGRRAYGETDAAATGDRIEPGWRLMGEFLGRV